MLNPFYMSKDIGEDKQEIARQWLHVNIDSSFLSLVIAFQREFLSYQKSLFSESINNTFGPDVWWAAVKKIKDIGVKFVNFTLHLMVTAKLATCNHFLN